MCSNLPEYGMFPLELRCLPEGHEELGSVSVRFPTVSHSNQTSSLELEALVKLVNELLPVDRLSPFSRAGRVSS